MSERTEVVVEQMLDRRPTPEEGRELVKQAFAQAKQLVGPGRVLGIVSRAVAVHRLTNKPTLIIKFAVEAPESIQPERRFTVGT